MSASPSPASKLVVAPGLTSRPLHFTNCAGERLVGTLEVLSHNAHILTNSAGDREQPRRSRCLLLCHGMLSHRSEFFLPAMSQALLQRCDSHIDAVYRFDWSGMGESEGTFQYGGYDKMTSEVLSAVTVLHAEGLSVSHLVGHSMAASAALLYASRYANIPHVVSIAPRFNMLVDPRFSKEDLLLLLRDGVMYMPQSRRQREEQQERIPVSLETYQARLRIDMTCVRRIAQHGQGGDGNSSSGSSGAGQSVHTLLIHGDADATIPQRDSVHAHHWITTGQGYGDDGHMLAAARESTCVMKQPLQSQEEVLRSDSFHPALTSALPHVFVPLAGADHVFKDPLIQHSLIQTVVVWVNEHGEHCTHMHPVDTLPVDVVRAASGEGEDNAAAAASSSAKL